MDKRDRKPNSELADEVHGEPRTTAGEAGTDRQKWPDVPNDWPRQLADADDAHAPARTAPDEEAREEEDEALAEASRSGMGPAARGARTQTGTGSTSGRS